MLEVARQPWGDPGDEAVVLALTHPGDPKSKARPRIGKGRAFTPESTRSAQDELAWALRLGLQRTVAGGLYPRSDICFGVAVEFYTASWQRRDLDNMLKLVMDAATGIVWGDDDQVVEVLGRLERAADEPRTELLFYVVAGAERPPTSTCEGCGASFRVYPSNPKRKFCSTGCSGRARQRRGQLVCSGCGASFGRKEAIAGRAKEPFCSEGCRRRHQKATTETMVPCDGGCGRSVIRPQSQFRGAKNFCSQSCRGRYYTGPLARRSDGTFKSKGEA